MGEFAPKIQAAAKNIKYGLQGSVERHNGQLFPSAIIDEPQVTLSGSVLTNIVLQEGPFGERAQWSSSQTGDTRLDRTVVIGAVHGSLSVYEALVFEGEIIDRRNFAIVDDPQTPTRPYYPIAPKEVNDLPTFDKKIIVEELETVVAALRNRRTNAA